MCCAGLNGEVVPDAPAGSPAAAEPRAQATAPAAAAANADADAAADDRAADAWGSPVATALGRDGDGAAPELTGAGTGDSSGGHSNRQGRKARVAAFRAAKAPLPVPPDRDAELRGPEPAAAEAGAARRFCACPAES